MRLRWGCGCGGSGVCSVGVDEESRRRLRRYY